MLSEIDSVAWPVKNAEFTYTFAYGLNIAKITKLYSIDSSLNAGSGLSIPLLFEPRIKFFSSEDFEHL
jgi:hypothetical protein